MDTNNVEFFEDNKKFTSRKILGTPETPGMVTFFIKTGIAKDEKQSYNILLTLLVISIIVMVLLFGYFVLDIGNPVQEKYSIPNALKEQFISNGVTIPK